MLGTFVYLEVSYKVTMLDTMLGIIHCRDGVCDSTVRIYLPQVRACYTRNEC